MDGIDTIVLMLLLGPCVDTSEAMRSFYLHVKVIGYCLIEKLDHPLFRLGIPPTLSPPLLFGRCTTTISLRKGILSSWQLHECFLKELLQCRLDRLHTPMGQVVHLDLIDETVLVLIHEIPQRSHPILARSRRIRSEDIIDVLQSQRRGGIAGITPDGGPVDVAIGKLGQVVPRFSKDGGGIPHGEEAQVRRAGVEGIFGRAQVGINLVGYCRQCRCCCCY